ncbi:Gfo/Idh/MocA family oxidoreductase [Runella slithyformis]|uniref:Oxidoreductase domain protein n=1 Tax=Runella slithyformis (strain ATCC 29530 / DSM 19594 / LMG 11500 / NCIMB 11436 / LSU 4) TaxID=761193 RepID=A0A7U3ZMW0_RUNSL|nr:Gfo/Idh/MocA family oxidoreductase [Runella slithyformis]AEI50142.1 oxidoreductase domain protein [Runella slithyformis DSM 19594]
MPTLNRRDVLKTLGLTAGAAALTSTAQANEIREITFPENPDYISLAQPITAIVLGAGNRGNVYGRYAVAYPGDVKMVGVAEPNEFRNERFAKTHGIEANHRFVTWEDVFKVPKFADAVIISTPDTLHYGPAIKALEMGYHILLEKPISPSLQECLDILAATKKSKSIIAVCHVLRYTAYFRKLKELCASGTLGEMISINHLEGIEHVHMAHSYVRGNWHEAEKTNPLILAKSSHDLDIMRWIANTPAKTVSAYGNLKWFKLENAPAGSTERCVEGCKVERECPFSAIKVYYEQKKRIHVLDVPEDPALQGPAILERLKTSNYGRCVYRMNNDQPDHYTSIFQFGNGILATFGLEAFTAWEARKTRVMFSMGEIEGDNDLIKVTDFRTKEVTLWKASAQKEFNTSGHGGGDHGLMQNFVQAVAQNNRALLTSTIEASIESHVMGFMAEASRKSGKSMEIKLQ